MAYINDLHIDDFCKDTALIWTMLYQSFPNTITLYVEDISGPDTQDEFGLHSPRYNACFNTVLWLAKAGYVQYKDVIQQEAFEHITLTHKAFTFLASSDMSLLSSDTATLSIPPTLPTRILDLRETTLNGTSTQLTKQVVEYMNAAKAY